MSTEKPRRTEAREREVCQRLAAALQGPAVRLTGDQGAFDRWVAKAIQYGYLPAT